MKSALMASVVAVALVGAVGIAIAAPSPSVSPVVKVADKVDNFQLTDTTRLAHELYYFKPTTSVIVLMSQSNGSKVSRAAGAELSKLADAYKAKGVLFYMVNSNLNE